MKPLISIVTPAWHAERQITRSVNSAQRQTHTQWEMIIVSDDEQNYEKILQDSGIKDSRLRFGTTGKTGAGASRARNIALDQARGDIVVVLDADDALESHKLETLLPHVLEHGAATSAIRIFHDETSREYPSLAQTFPAGPLSPEDYVRANVETFALLVWDRRRVEGRWDETLFFSEDLVHGLSMYNELDGIYYHPSPLHMYHRHGRTMTNEIGKETFSLSKIAELDQALLNRALTNNLPVKDPQALQALIRFHGSRTNCMKNFAVDPSADPVMAFYHFVKNNRDAFLVW